MRRAGELGYLGLCFPEEYGGQGGDYYYSLVRAECMSYSGSGGTNMGFAVQTDMVLPADPPAGHRGAEAALPGARASRARRSAASGSPSPAPGSDVAGIRTKAIRDGDDYLITGSKTFITNGPRADFILLVAKTDPDARHEGITLFLVDLRDDEGNHVPGFEVSRKLEKMGMHASDTGELAFNEVRVPADAVLGEIGKGFYHISWELQGERLVAAAGCVAGAERMFEKTLEYAKEREAFGRPIGRFQAIRHKFAEMATKIEAAKQFNYVDRLALRERRVPGARDHRGEAVRLANVLRGRRRVRPDPRRLRLHEGVRDRARLPRRPAEPDRRRHRRDHARRDRPLLRPVGRPARSRQGSKSGRCLSLVGCVDLVGEQRNGRGPGRGRGAPPG